MPFKKALNGTNKFSTTLDLALHNDWDLLTLQDHLRIKEVSTTPYDHSTLLGSNSGDKKGNKRMRFLIIMD